MLYEKNGEKAKVNKLFKSSTLIGGLSGFLSKGGFRLIDVMQHATSFEDLREILASRVPADVALEDFIILLSSNENNRLKHVAIKGNSNDNKILYQVRKENLFHRLIAYDLVDRSEYQAIKDSFHNDYYAQHLDFNFNYVSEEKTDDIEKHPTTFYTLFHIKAFRRYRSHALKGLLRDSPSAQVSFLKEFYTFIDGLKDKTGLFSDRNRQIRTIGRCTHILAIDTNKTRWWLNE